jgi:GNAT superfamily N-acetyltransferase
MAVKGDSDIGAFYLNWKPKYAIYQRLNIPELQDLRVLPGHRRQGAATAMIAKAEDMAKAAGRTGIGLSVGLSADYGAAQRLYARLAYIPDGNGVTYDRQPVEKGEKRPIDDDLALMLVKFF